MTTYSLLGYALRSDLEFPELRTLSQAEPRWSFRSRPSDAGIPAAVLLREATALPCTIRLYRTQGGYWLEHLCTGSYFVSDDGSRIEYQPLPHAYPDAVRFDLLGRVIALALHVGGWLCLHGSAVRVGGGVVGFVAPKGYGKSTLASSLVRAGGQLVSDDLLVIEPGDPALALPGVHRLRLRDDSFGSVVLDRCKAERGPDGKHVISDFPEDRLMTAPARLTAVYCIEPVPPGPGDFVVGRELLTSPEAARALVSMGKNTAVLDQLEILDALGRAVQVASQVPVYRLRVTRDLDQIGAVSNRLLEWHPSDALSPTPAG